MPTIVQTFHGRVTHVWGTATILGDDGKMHPLKVGDEVVKGDVLLTSQNGIVKLEDLDEAARTATAKPGDTELDRVISDLNTLNPLDPTAAGVAGGDGAGDLTPGLRVDRIHEGLTPASMEQPGDLGRILFEPAGQARPQIDVTTPPTGIGADSTIINATEEGAPVSVGLTPPTGTSPAAVITVTQIPVIGLLIKADGSTVTAGTVLSPADLTGLKYVPPADYNGTSPVGEFTYKVTDGTATAIGTVDIHLGTVNDAPVANPDVAQGIEDTPLTGNVLTNDTDVDGDVLHVTQFQLAGVTVAAGNSAVIPGVGSLVVNADGSYVFNPAADYNGAVPVVTYTITDGTVTTTSTLTIGITPVADAPRAADDLASTPINAPVIVPVLANDRSPDGDPLTVTGATLANPANGAVAINPDGTITFTPATNFTGPATITYEISDGHGGTASATVTVNVGNNTPPTGADSVHTTAEDTPYTVGVADFGFHDVDAGQGLANVRIDTLPAAGVLLLSGNAVAAGAVISAADIAAGHLVFVPSPDGNGSPYAAFGFSVQDSSGAFDTTPNTLTVNVTPVNDAPVAVNDVATTPINTAVAVTVLGNDTDADGDTLTVSAAALADPSKGSVTINPDGTLGFTPAANVTGPVVINYTISDGHGGTATATATVTVGSNTPPTGADSVHTIAEDGNYVVQIADLGYADADTGQSLANIRIDTLPAAGTLQLSGVPVTVGALISSAEVAAGHLVLVPAANGNGSPYAGFSFSVQDSGGAFDVAPNTLTLNVTPINDAPVAVADVNVTPEDTPLVADAAHGVLANDIDVDTGTTLNVTGFSVAGLAGTFAPGSTAAINGVGTLVLNANGSYTFTPVADYNGPVPVITYTVSDGALTSSSTLTLAVSPVNDPPVLSLDADHSHNIVTVQPIAGLFNTGESAAGTLLPIGSADPHYVLTSRPILSGLNSIAVSEVPGKWLPGDADSAWVGSPDTQITGIYRTNTSFTLQAGADPRSVHISFDLVADNALRDILVNGVSTGISTSAGFAALTHFDLNGYNSAFQSGVNTITFVVDNRDSLAGLYSGPVGFRIDNMTSSVAVITPSGSTHVGDYATIYVEGTPVSISDTDTSIKDVDSPNLQSATITLTNAQLGDVLLAGGMPAGITATVNAAGTTVTLTGGASLASYEAAIHAVQFSNTTNNPSTAIDRLISVVVNDGAANSNLATTTVHVVEANSPPTLDLDANDSTAPGVGYAGAYVENGAPVKIVDADTKITDLDSTQIHSATVHITNVQAGDVLTVAGLPSGISAAVYDRTNGVLTLSGTASLAVYQAALNGIGFSNSTDTPSGVTRTIEITVNDGGVNSNVAVSQISVTPVNDAPTAVVPGATTLAEDGSVVFSTGNGNAISVADVDSPTLTVTVAATNGALTLGSTGGVVVTGNGTGSVTLSGTPAAIDAALNGTSYKPTSDYSGPAQVTVSTSDGVAPAVVSTIGITVTPVADIHADAATTFENTAVVIDVNANDTFSNAGHLVTAINGQAIAIGGSVAMASGTVMLQANGTLLFTPAAGYNTGSGAPASFSYTVMSGGVTETANVDVTVTPVNNAAIPTLSATSQGYWTLDEGSGTTTANKSYSQTGTLTDSTPSPLTAPTWIAGHVATSGSAMRFDGAGSFVALDAAATAPLMGTGSLSFWIKTTQTGSASASSSWDSPAVIASEQSGGGNDIQWGALNSTGKIGFGIGNVTGVFSTTSVNDNAWHQVAITRDATTKLVNVYVDGVLEASGSPNDANFSGLLNRLSGLGANNSFSNDAPGTDIADTRFLKADLDDVRIYNHVLTTDQVVAIKSVEAGYHDLAVANDGEATRLHLASTDYTSMQVSGLNAGMVITDGTAGHTITATNTDTAIDLTGWNFNSVSISGTGAGSATLVFNATDTVNGESHSTTQYLNIVNGTSLLAGGAGNDTLSGTANADLMVGNAGNDILNGNDGNDRLIGGAGNDILNGGNGNDIIHGGAGNDLMTGGTGADTFVFQLADRGAPGAPAGDTITDFNVAPVSAGGDSLDLRDLLVGANHVGANPGNLQSYIDFDTTSNPGSTVVRISSTGGFAGGNYAAGSEDERITLQGVDLRSALNLGAAATDNQIITELLTRNKLVTDHP